MGYSGAGLGFGLQQGFSGLGATLMGIGDRKREQEAREQAVKMHQMERKEDQTRQSERWAMEDSRYADQQKRLAEATANAETIRRGEANAAAIDKANEYMAGGQTAQINPGKVYFTGSPLDGTLQQNQTLQAESGVPTVTAGAYDPKQDIGLQRSQSLAKTYIDMGAGPKGQVTRPPTGTGAIADDVKQRLIDSANAQMGGDYSKLPEVLQTLTQRGAPETYLAFIRSYFSGTRPSGGGNGMIPDFNP